MASERPVAALLSGGLDSSLVCAIAQRVLTNFGRPPLQTFSIGMEGSTDLEYARKVAKHIRSVHTEISVTADQMFSVIPRVIHDIESYDITTVRASVGNWLCGQYIRQNTACKVVLNGDGSDELMGGYLYMGMAPDALEFDRECRRLLGDIHRFDVLRSDKCISSHGLEPRTPFLDRAWVQYYLSIPMSVRFHTDIGEMEKYLVRNAFSWYFFKSWDAKALLPDKILFRKKEAFSDGVTAKKRSLFEILGEFAEKKKGELDLDVDGFLKGLEGKNLPKTMEQMYYRYLFENEYKGMGSIVPYFWMPKYVEATDASARTLSIYCA
jgi:asparagine synthase (glutamine-hydrolysing)